MPGKPAARNLDMHVCFKPIPSPPGTPHGPGMIQAAGASRVFINGVAAAVEGDQCICIPEPGNRIKQGSTSVFFGSKGAARQMDPTLHAPGGMIQQGATNVFIGG